MHIASLRMLQIDNARAQYRRPYCLEANNEMLDRLDHDIRSSDRVTVRPSIVADAVAVGLQLDSQGELVGIDGEWDTARFRFVLEVVIDEPHANMPGQRIVVCGYTDKFDVSHNNEVSDNTVMYVNSIINIRDTISSDRRGYNTIISKVFNNYHLLLGDYDNPHATRGRYRADHSMRPNDVYSTIERIRELGIDEDDLDTRTVFAEGIKGSKRSNSQRTRWMSTMIDKDREGAASTAMYGDSDDIFSSARNTYASEHAREPKYVNDEFIRAVARGRGMGQFAEDRSFEYRDLIALCGKRATFRDLDDLTDITTMNDSRADESEQWRGASKNVIIATSVCHEIPAIMADCLMSSITFNASNVDGDAEVVIIPNSTHMLISGDFGNAPADAFAARFILEVFNIISHNDRLEVEMEVDCEVGGMTTVELKLNGGSWERYSFPSFADANLTPSMTNRGSVLTNLAEKYERIRTDIVDRLLMDDPSMEVGPERTERSSRPRDDRETAREIKSFSSAAALLADI